MPRNGLGPRWRPTRNKASGPPRSPPQSEETLMSLRTSNISRSWIPYAGLLVLFWGVWGAFSDTPNSKYGYPDGMVYVLWALTMLIPAFAAMRGKRFDRRPIAAVYGLIVGLTGAGGQLLLFKTLTIGPAYLIFPLVALS